MLKPPGSAYPPNFKSGINIDSTPEKETLNKSSLSSASNQFLFFRMGKTKH
ncbi:hypothetical protein LEP1GSC124_3204, partial [Leptospira interrogans serovar Pyrogenes str. 200701872]